MRRAGRRTGHRAGRMVHGAAMLGLTGAMALGGWVALPHLARLAGIGQSDPLLRKLVVRVDAASGTPGARAPAGWQFAPLQRRMTLRLGETGVAFFTAVNGTDRTVSASPQVRVSPASARPYVQALSCGCGAGPRLGPHQRAELPFTFYLDPAIARDPATRGLRSITLSYSFKAAARPTRQAALLPAAGKTLKE